MGVSVEEHWQKVNWNKFFLFSPIQSTSMADLLKDYKKVKDLFGDYILIRKKEGENEEEECNDVFIYKTLIYPPKSSPPTKS